MEVEEKEDEKIFEIFIGSGDDDASFFNEEKGRIILPIIVKNSFDGDKDVNSFERALFISGLVYDKVSEDSSSTSYILECETYKQLERIVPYIKNVYDKRGFKVNIVLKDECREFLAK